MRNRISPQASMIDPDPKPKTGEEEEHDDGAPVPEPDPGEEPAEDAPEPA